MTPHEEDTFRHTEVGQARSATVSTSCQSCRGSDGCSQPNEVSHLFPQWNLSHQAAHDIIQLTVFLRAVRIGIVTANTGLADGAVRLGSIGTL
jgi:hypothetical protein